MNYRDTASNSRKAGHDPRSGRERRQEARRIGLEHKGSKKPRAPTSTERLQDSDSNR